MLDLSPARLEELGVAALALDFDGVLAPHGAGRPLPVVEDWLQRMVGLYGADRLFILSNRPEASRLAWFSEKLPGVRVVTGVRKKPYCDGLLIVGELAAVPLASILMVDDRLLTGCLAAVRAGSQPYYVRAPFIDLRQKTRSELFFMLLRWGERLLVGLLP